MAPQFALAVRRLKYFFVNSEKTAGELRNYVRSDASIQLYRPTVANHFGLETTARTSVKKIAAFAPDLKMVLGAHNFRSRSHRCCRN